jgi:hypothetical protein
MLSERGNSEKLQTRSQLGPQQYALARTLCIPPESRCLSRAFREDVKPLDVSQNAAFAHSLLTYFEFGVKGNNSYEN